MLRGKSNRHSDVRDLLTRVEETRVLGNRATRGAWCHVNVWPPRQGPRRGILFYQLLPTKNGALQLEVRLFRDIRLGKIGEV